MLAAVFGVGAKDVQVVIVPGLQNSQDDGCGKWRRQTVLDGGLWLPFSFANIVSAFRDRSCLHLQPLRSLQRSELTASHVLNNIAVHVAQIEVYCF